MSAFWDSRVSSLLKIADGLVGFFTPLKPGWELAFWFRWARKHQARHREASNQDDAPASRPKGYTYLADDGRTRVEVVLEAEQNQDDAPASRQD